jgi:fructokinase
MKRFDVTALGELLIDFTENGESSQGNPLFEANPGGAPCNVLAFLQKMGFHTAFIGKVGQDLFGRKLTKVLEEVGIDHSGLVYDPDVRTTLSFVHTLRDGDREFSFYRNPGADMMLREEEVRDDIIADARIFHLGTLSMTDEGVRKATEHAVSIAKQNHLLITFDPNLRLPLWKSEEDARDAFTYGMGICDVLKISDNEIRWYTGKEDLDAGIAVLQERFHTRVILLSKGKDGSMAVTEQNRVSVPADLRDDTIETTGAGDTFFGACITYLLRHDLQIPDREGMGEMLRFATAAASLITTRRGALRVMPDETEVRQNMAEHAH